MNVLPFHAQPMGVHQERFHLACHKIWQDAEITDNPFDSNPSRCEENVFDSLAGHRYIVHVQPYDGENRLHAEVIFSDHGFEKANIHLPLPWMILWPGSLSHKAEDSRAIAVKMRATLALLELYHFILYASGLMLPKAGLVTITPHGVKARYELRTVEQRVRDLEEQERVAA